MEMALPYEHVRSSFEKVLRGQGRRERLFTIDEQRFASCEGAQEVRMPLYRLPRAP